MLSNCELRAAFPLRDSHPSTKNADFEDERKGPLCGPFGRAFGSHPRGRRFDPVRVHQLKYREICFADFPVFFMPLCGAQKRCIFSFCVFFEAFATDKIHFVADAPAREIGRAHV